MTTYRERMQRYEERAKELQNKDQTEEIRRAAQAVKEAERIVIGGAAGLSAANGLDYMSEEVLKKEFPYLWKRGYTYLWQALWSDDLTEMQKWVICADELRWVYYEMPVLPVYEDLKKIVEGKDYFIISSNIDEQFQKAGFPLDRLHCPQNSKIRFQCSIPCGNHLWDVKEDYDNILKHADFETLTFPEEYLPRCPKCGAPATRNLSGRPEFVPDEVMALEKDYLAYLNDAKDKKVVFLELGVGFNTPGVIRNPFQRMTRLFPQATLIRMNRDHSLVPEKIQDKAIEIGGDIGVALKKWVEML